MFGKPLHVIPTTFELFGEGLHVVQRVSELFGDGLHEVHTGFEMVFDGVFRVPGRLGEASPSEIQNAKVTIDPPNKWAGEIRAAFHFWLQEPGQGG
jgi:hypothetical protein